MVEWKDVNDDPKPISIAIFTPSSTKRKAEHRHRIRLSFSSVMEIGRGQTDMCNSLAAFSDKAMLYDENQK